MNEETKAALKALFKKREEKQHAAKQAQAAKESAEDAFLRQFSAVRQNVIAPVLNEMADYVKARGVECAVRKTDPENLDGQRFSTAGIALVVYAGKDEGHYRPDRDYPAFSFNADKAAKKVGMHERTIGPGRGGCAGYVGAGLSLDQITADVIQSHIVKFLGEIL
jgi:hypothetical protein